MYRIRFHGRGGQGMKTASRMLGTALFLEGYEVQDAPRYGAERRGAPIFAYVRAAREPIHERGVIRSPQLVVVADDTLVAMSAAGVLTGLSENTVLFLITEESEDTWKERLKTSARLVLFPPEDIDVTVGRRRLVGAICAGAAARLLGLVSREHLQQAIETELEELGETVVQANVEKALHVFDEMSGVAGIVSEEPIASATSYTVPEWIQVPFDDARISAPGIHAAATSEVSQTGLWRTMRPVLESERCKGCVWICGSLCPDSVIERGEDGFPQIDYDHCKGCMICVVQCPSHAYVAISEQQAQAEQSKGEPS